MATIRKRKNRWEAQIRIKGFKNTCKSFLYYEDAKKWAKEIERKIEQGSYVDFSESHQTTLRDLLKRYLDEVSPQKKSYRNEKYLIPKLMENTLLLINIILAAILVVLVLIQKSEGGALGIGISQDNFMFSRSAGNILTKSTAVIATLFIICSLSLTIISRSELETDGSVLDKIEENQEETPKIPENNN